ncbi:MAG TPA: glycosyltransferase [Opitutaceae bacterium]|nr:glycosyltransferase [Opitutaceae bacterium]
MNINFPVQHYFAYITALEAERVMREFTQSLTAPAIVPELIFQNPVDPEVELSILLPVWNPDFKQFERCLKSLAAQDFGGIKYEIIVSDNASDTDVVRRALSQVGLEHARYHRHETNIGGFPNFNWCITASRGKWLHILSHDDWIEQGFYAALLRGEAERTESDLRICRTRIVDETNGATNLMQDLSPTPQIIPDFLERESTSQHIQFVGALFSRRAAQTIGGFDPKLGAGADWEYWTRLSSRFSVFYHPGSLANYALHQASWSNREGGYEDVESFRKFRRILVRILAHVPESRRYAIATGFVRNMLSRLIGIAMRNRKANVSSATRVVFEAFLVGCSEGGFLTDIEKILQSTPV